MSHYFETPTGPEQRRSVGDIYKARVNAVLPLIDKLEHNQPIRVWVTACATGEEAYSLAILFNEEIAWLFERLINFYPGYRMWCERHACA